MPAALLLAAVTGFNPLINSLISPPSARQLIMRETVRPAAWPTGISELCRREDGNLLQASITAGAFPATSGCRLRALPWRAFRG